MKTVMRLLLFLLVVALQLPKCNASKLSQVLTFPAIPDNHQVHRLPPGDDLGVIARLNQTLLFAGKTYDHIFVNQNGILSFRKPVPFYKPSCEYSGRTAIIAAFWADVQTSHGLGGNITYYESRNFKLLAKASRDIETYYRIERVDAKWLFVATWLNVTYFGANRCLLPLAYRPRNTFQIVIAVDNSPSKPRSYVLFYFSRISWLAGTASRGSACGGLHGHPAKVGFHLGDGASFLHIPGSCSNNVLDLDATPTIPYVYRVDEATVATVKCDSSNETAPLVSPQFVDIFGHVLIEITGPCFEDHFRAAKSSNNVTCVFYDSGSTVVGQTKATLRHIGSTPSATCMAPYFYETGPFSVQIFTSDKNGNTNFYQHGRFNVHSKPPKVIFNLLSDGAHELQWKPNDLDSRNQGVDIELIGYDLEKGFWQEGLIRHVNLVNSGKFRGTVAVSQNKTENKIYSYANSFLIFKISLHNKEMAGSIFTEPFCASSIFPVLQGEQDEERPSDWCDSWYAEEDSRLNAMTCLPPCPPLVDLARLDPSFQDECFSQPMLNFLHPGAVASFRSVIPDPATGSTQQCTYGPNGNLLAGPASGGNVRKTSSFLNPIAYWKNDALPRCWCCLSASSDISEFFRTCGQYYARRPSDLGFGYVAPSPPALIRGFSHITTFENVTYTLVSNSEDGNGQLVLGKIDDNSFEIQGRTRRYFDQNATIFTSFIIRDQKTFLEIQLSRFCDASAPDESTNFVVKFNGRPLATASSGQFGRAVITSLKSGQIDVTSLSNCLMLRISASFCALSVVVSPMRTTNCPYSRQQKVQGLLYGNFENMYQREALFRRKNDQELTFECLLENEVLRQICGKSYQCLHDVCIILSQNKSMSLDFASLTAKLEHSVKKMTDLSTSLAESVATKTCPPLPGLSSFENGHFEATNATFVGSRINFFCNSKNEYIMADEQFATIECRPSRSWSSNILPSCVPNFSLSPIIRTRNLVQQMSRICWCCEAVHTNKTHLCCSTAKCNGTPSRLMCENVQSGYCEVLSAWEKAKPICSKPIYPCDRSKYEEPRSSYYIRAKKKNRRNP